MKYGLLASAGMVLAAGQMPNPPMTAEDRTVAEALEVLENTERLETLTPGHWNEIEKEAR